MRRAKFYSPTRFGKEHLAEELERLTTYSEAVLNILGT